jgi:FMN reductase
MTMIVVGNPKARSRTLDAAQVVVRELTGREPDICLDLVDFGAALLDWSDPRVAAAVEQVKETRLLVVASPTYKGTYTGVLKLFLDRFGAGSLAHVTAIPLMLGGDWRHSLAPEVFLKPVLAELGASTPTRGLFLLDSDAQDGFATSPTLGAWLDAARPQLSLVTTTEPTS